MSNLPPLSPYPLVRVENVRDRGTEYEGSTIYEFVTESGVLYELIFRSDSDYLPQNSPIASLTYSVILNRISEKVAMQDPRISQTVAYGLDAAFEENPHLIITYQCSTADFQQKQRARMFKSWYQVVSQWYSRIDSPGGSDMYATAIYRKGNPFEEIIEETMEEVYRK